MRIFPSNPVLIHRYLHAVVSNSLDHTEFRSCADRKTNLQYRGHSNVAQQVEGDSVSAFDTETLSGGLRVLSWRRPRPDSRAWAEAELVAAVLNWRCGAKRYDRERSVVMRDTLRRQGDGEDISRSVSGSGPLDVSGGGSCGNQPIISGEIVIHRRISRSG